MKRILQTLPLTAALLLLAAGGARANALNLTLTQAFQYANPGDPVSFDATVSAPETNDSAIYLNGDNTYVDLPLSLADDPFLSSFPLSLSPGDSYEGTLFTVTVPSGTPDGIYTGYFKLLGGADGNASDALAYAAFNVDVSTVPEPGSAALFGMGLAGLLVVARRRFRR